MKGCRHFGILAVAVAWALSASAQAQNNLSSVGSASRGADIGTASLQIEGDIAYLRLPSASEVEPKLRTIGSVDDALAILADERLACVWPDLLKWAGPDLRLLRERALARAAQAFVGDSTPPTPKDFNEKSSRRSSKKFLVLTQYILALNRSGRTGEAIELTKSQIVAPTSGGNQAFNQAQLKTILAALLFDAGDADHAIEVLRRASNDPKIKKSYKMNVDTNLALTLARTGQYSEALNMIDQVAPAHAESNSGLFGNPKNPASNAYFSAIRACALKGLGREAEALETVAMISGETSASVQLSESSVARLISFSCMHDDIGLAKELANQLSMAPPAGDIFLFFQVGKEVYPAERETLEKAIAQDVAVKAMGGRVRVLSGVFRPALASWRQPNTSTNP